MRRVLIKALGQAVTWERLAKNPARATTPPKVERKRMIAYDAEQTGALLDALRPTRLFMPVLQADAAERVDEAIQRALKPIG